MGDISMKQRATFSIGKFLIYIALIILSATALTPFLWMISTALKQSEYVLSIPPRFIPDPVSISSFTRLFDIFPMGRMFFNSVVVTAAALLGQLVTSAMAAYAFARIEFRFRKVLFFLYVMTLMVPYQVTVTPLFILMSKLRLVNTYGGLILPVFYSAFGVFLLHQAFLTMPRELEESAFIDGASPGIVFLRIYLPLIKPSMVTLGVLSFMGVWNSFLWPLFVIRDQEMMTLPVGLAALQGEYLTEWNMVMAGALISLVPIIIVFLLAQKYFIQGMSRSGIKN
ncbi:MAG: carbohydrate ABC transporter permease [Spirochaetales bacterium]|nr:carbohydrate ABC transporter permease [Spirochaetales bacterium]